MSARDKIKYIPKDGQHQEPQKGKGRREERADRRKRREEGEDDKMLSLSLRLIRAQREIWTGIKSGMKVVDVLYPSCLIS